MPPMRARIPIQLAMLAALLGSSGSASAVTIHALVVSEDASVTFSPSDAGSAATNYGSSNELISGTCENFGFCGPPDVVFRLFLKFSLPTLQPGTWVESATLTGIPILIGDPNDSNHELYLVGNDGWSEASVTWNTQPALSTHLVDLDPTGLATLDPVALLLPASVVDAEYQGDGTLSLAMRIDDETLAAGGASVANFIDFASKEGAVSNAQWEPFVLTVTIVPEPSTALLVAAGLGLIGSLTAARRAR